MREFCTNRTIEFVAPIDIEAASADGAPKPRRFSLAAYNGGMMRLKGFAHPVVVDLAGLRVPDSLPVLRDHDISKVVGHAERIDNDGKRVAIEGVVSGSNEHAREVVAAHDSGFPWQVSIGAPIDRVFMVPEGKTITANGMTHKGPLVHVAQAELREASFVAVGADGTTSAVIAATKGRKMEKELEAQTTETNVDLQAEELRIERIRDIVAKYRRGSSWDGTAVDDKGNSIAVEDHAIEAGWAPEKAELWAMRHSRPKFTPKAARPSDECETIKAALELNAGRSEEDVARDYSQRVVNDALSPRFRNFGIQAAMDVVNQRAGRPYTGSRGSRDFILHTFESDRHIQASGFSTLSLPGLLGNTAGKALLDSYEATAVTWPAIAKPASNSDFKEHERYRVDSTGALKKVGADGELKHFGLSENKFTSQLDTYGLMISLNRQMVINDDLGGFLEIPGQIGRLAALRIEESVYALLLSNPSSFFSAGNSNLLTGASSALDLDSLDDGTQLMMDQVDANGKPVLVTPRLLLVPTPLHKSAKSILNSTQLNLAMAGSSDATLEKPSGNPFANSLDLRVSPYLNNTAITDQDGSPLSGTSSTAWYLFADPRKGVAAMEVAFLNGRRRPTIESGQVDFNTLGIQWRAYHDFGVSMLDHRAAVKSDGA